MILKERKEVGGKRKRISD